MAESAAIKAVLAKEPPLLEVSFGTEKVKEQGQYLPRAIAASAPTIAFPGATPGKKYIIINVDLDAPFASLPFMSPIAHWIKHDLSTTSPVSTATSPQEGVLESETKTLAEWAPPRPPPGAGPHRYVFCLYEQPADFTLESIAPVGEMTRLGRMRFDFEGFQKKAGLGSVVAGAWFVSN